MFSLCCSLTWVLCCCPLFPLPFGVERCFSLLNPCLCVGGLLVFASIPVHVGILNETSRPLILRRVCAHGETHTCGFRMKASTAKHSLLIALWQEATQFRKWQYVQSAFFKDLYERERVLPVLSCYRTLELKWHCDCTHNQRLLLAWDWK
jgi:hypothetical protein